MFVEVSLNVERYWSRATPSRDIALTNLFMVEAHTIYCEAEDQQRVDQQALRRSHATAMRCVSLI
jgi:hypothetical protein